jgi:hypothetical protein
MRPRDREDALHLGRLLGRGGKQLSLAGRGRTDAIAAATSTPFSERLRDLSSPVSP